MAHSRIAILKKSTLTTDPGLLEACWRDFVLGVVQGLTEFLPISSTAHLKVVPVLAGWGDPGVSVTAVIQLGSIVAVIAYFRADLAATALLLQPPKSTNPRPTACKTSERKARNPTARLRGLASLGLGPPRSP